MNFILASIKGILFVFISKTLEIEVRFYLRNFNDFLLYFEQTRFYLMTRHDMFAHAALVTEDDRSGIF